MVITTNLTTQQSGFNHQNYLTLQQVNPVLPTDQSIVYESPFFNKKQSFDLPKADFMLSQKNLQKLTRHAKGKHSGEYGQFQTPEADELCDHTVSLIMKSGHLRNPSVAHRNTSAPRTEEVTFDLSLKSPFPEQ